MKTYFKTEQEKKYYMNLRPVIIVFLLSAVMLSACGSNHEKARQEELKQVRQSVEEDLGEIKKEIDQRMTLLTEEIDQTGDEMKTKLQDARSELREQRDLLEIEIEKVEKATLENWDIVISSVSEKVQKIQSKTNEVSRNVREWLYNDD